MLPPARSRILKIDESPFSSSTTSNWVARAGGLPPYIRGIAHALVRAGHPESDAIATAIAAVKRWASGAQHVHPDTRAKAASALAQWEAARAKSHVHKDEAAGAAYNPAMTVAQDLDHPGQAPVSVSQGRKQNRVCPECGRADKKHEPSCPRMN